MGASQFEIKCRNLQPNDDYQKFDSLCFGFFNCYCCVKSVNEWRMRRYEQRLQWFLCDGWGDCSYWCQEDPECSVWTYYDYYSACTHFSSCSIVDFSCVPDCIMGRTQ